MSHVSESDGARSGDDGGRGARPHMLTRIGNRASLSLLLASALSVVFVVIVGLLIAFMQYQSRLLRAQPALTPAQLVYYVETERNIRQSLERLKDLSEKITKETPRVSYALNGIQFRIDRICGLFATDGENKADRENVQKCAAFLRNIPFEGTKSETSTEVASRNGSGSAMTEPVAVARPVRDTPAATLEPTSRELLRSIQTQFVRVMGERKVGDVDLSKIIELYSSDMDIVARLNQWYWGELHTQYNFMVEQHRALCDHIDYLTNIIRDYRRIDSGCDQSRRTLATTRDAASDGGRPQPQQTRPETVGASAPARAALASDQRQLAQDQTAPGVTAPPPAGGPIVAAPDEAARNGGTDLPSQESSPLVGGPIIPDGTAAENTPRDRQRAFEFVSHYQFYEGLALGYLKDILISPSDFLALMLVFFAGILGALLRIVFFTYVSGKDPNVRNVVIGPILGLICALVVYILFRAGFIAITDHPQNAETSVLSPFLIAILAMAAGLLSERAIDLFRKTSGTWLGSVEASQAGRWAVHLQTVLSARNMTIEDLAQRLDVSAQKLTEWADEKDLVPYDKQRDIAFVLNVPIRQIFTDIDPRAAAGAV